MIVTVVYSDNPTMDEVNAAAWSHDRGKVFHLSAEETTSWTWPPTPPSVWTLAMNADFVVARDPKGQRWLLRSAHTWKPGTLIRSQIYR